MSLTRLNDALVFRHGDCTYGVVPVPDTDTLGIFYRGADEWFGISAINWRGGSSALLGRPNTDTTAALDAALVTSTGNQEAKS